MNPPIAESPLPQKGVQLPEPDTENITVLTHQLPNEPILPWHHFDSPWLKEEEREGEPESSDADAVAEETLSEQSDQQTEVNSGDGEATSAIAEPASSKGSELPEPSDLSEPSALTQVEASITPESKPTDQEFA